VNPLGHDTGWLGRVGRTRVEAGWAVPWIRLKCRFLNKKLFSFSNLFYKLQINLNFNDFITPRKICNGMNATNNYLFKYITL
jgi:hypothetical protein